MTSHQLRLTEINPHTPQISFRKGDSYSLATNPGLFAGGGGGAFFPNPVELRLSGGGGAVFLGRLAVDPEPLFWM